MQCPNCGKALVERKGKYGMFLGCSGFPKCKTIVQPKTLQPTVTTPITIVGSPQQNAIWSEIEHGMKHLIVQARAGTGKSFTIIHASTKVTGLKVGFAAFNNHIAKELREKGVNAFTNHALGKAAVHTAFGKVELDEHKVSGILDELVGTSEDVDYVKNMTTRLVSLCKFNLLDGTVSNLDELSTLHALDLNESRDKIFALVPKVLQLSKERKGVIDFDDMVWFPIVHNLPVEHFDLLFVDEAQDLNKCQQALVLKAIGSTGRMVVVGDPCQAIYGFSGADTTSMATLESALAATERNVSTLPLTVTRRCPKSHIALAQEIVPDIEAMESAIEGSVETLSLYAAQDKMHAGDLVICRVNAPLVSICYSLLRDGIKAIIRGRDIGKGLQALIKKLKAKSIEDLCSKVEIYRAKELVKLEAKGKKGQGQIISLNDKCDTVQALTEDVRDLSELKAKIENLFSDTDSKNAVILSSVHRAKGLEADTVYIAKPELMPHPMAALPWQIEQEYNLKYVALTRSKKNLVFIKTK